MPAEEETFFHKLGEIPVVNDGWTSAWDYYSKVKEYNALTRMSLGMAESSVKVAGMISTPVLSPVISKYQPQIDTVNDYACKKLDEFEEKYPIVKLPTNEVKEACTEYIEPVVDKVKPVVTQVQGVVETSRKQVARMKSCGFSVVNGAKDLSVNTVAHVVHVSFETTPGRFVTGTIEGMLDKADEIVDKYLPEKEETSLEDQGDEPMEQDPIKGPIEPMEKDHPTPERVAMHLKCVSEKIRRRMFRLAVKDFRKAKAETMNALNKMTNTIELINYAKANMDSARIKVEDMWTKIVDENGEKDKGSVFAGTIEERIIALGIMMAGQVKSGVHLLEKTSSELGSFAKDPLSKTKEYSEIIKSFNVVRSLQDFSSERLERLNKAVNFLQKKCRDFLEGFELPSSLNMDLPLSDVDLQDADVTMEQVISSNNNSEDELEREDANQSEIVEDGQDTDHSEMQ